MAVRTRTFFICATLATLFACGGDDGDGVTVVDAALPIDAAIDAPIDAMVCNAPNMVCAGVCTDVSSDNQFCGDCDTSCSGGEICEASACDCVDPFVPANPAGLTMIFEQVGLNLGIVVYGTTTTNLLLGGIIIANTQEDTPYQLTDQVGTPPFIAAGYDVDLGSQTAAAAYYATAGTITFSKICPANSPNGAGFSGTLTNATFSAVEGLTNPVLVPGGCSFDVPSVTFSFGDVSCSNK